MNGAHSAAGALGVITRGMRGPLGLSLLGSLLGGVAGAALVPVLNRSLFVAPESLPRLAAQFTGLAAASLVLQSAAELGFARVRHAVLARLRQQVSAQIAHLPYRQLETAGASKLLGIATQDVAHVSALFVVLPRAVIQGVVVLGCLGYLAWLSWLSFLIVLTLMILGCLGQRRARRRGNAELSRARVEEDNVFARFRELLAGAKELRLHARRRLAFLSEEVGPSVHAVERARILGLSTHSAADSFGSLLFFLAIGGVAFGVSAGLGSSAEVQSGSALALLFMMQPMDQLVRALPVLGRASIAFERVRSLGPAVAGPAVAGPAVAGPAALTPTAAVGSLPPMAAPPRAAARFSIGLKAVTHEYRRDTEDGTFRLGPIDLELAAGELTFLIGGNGSGKTTLAKLLVGLYEPDGGKVMLNGVPVTPQGRAGYREHFSAVFSDHHVFPNLVGLDAEGGDARARELLDALHLSHKVQIEGGVLSTTALSRGQLKRLALLVALLEDRPAYVFDEWAADQEPDYRRSFYERILPGLRARGKAVLVITHDDEHFALADRRVRLEEGRIHPGTPSQSSAANTAS